MKYEAANLRLKLKERDDIALSALISEMDEIISSKKEQNEPDFLSDEVNNTRKILEPRKLQIRKISSTDWE